VSEKKKHLIVVCGPTAVGKTAFAIGLARHFGTEILSADSRQFYRDMRIGTAYPGPEELAAVKHHFIGHLSIDDEYNAARFEEDAILLLDDLFSRHDMVILAGGSGLYIDAVCKGIDELPDHDPELRRKLKAELGQIGIRAFGEKLKNLDPEYYATVDLNNPNRLLRAVEVCLQTGKTYTSLRRKTSKPRPFSIIKAGLNMKREELDVRIEKRVDLMMEKGLMQEAEALLPCRERNALNTVGYKEMFAYLDGEVSLDQAIANIKTNTRRYARRQLTWFMRDKEIRWFGPDELKQAIEWINQEVL
jgi:tRNA dimethylallyltransferase